MSAPAPTPEDAAAQSRAKPNKLKDTVLPALGFTVLVCAVWYAYFQINTSAPAPEQKQVLPPVERPAQVVGHLFVPNPKQTWKTLRPFGSAAFGIYPSRAATFITAGFGLPPYLDSQVKDEAPLVGALAVDDRGTYWVLGASVVDGRELLAELTEGADPYFFKEDHSELGLTLVQPKPGRTPVSLIIAICGDMVLVAEDDEQLMKLGPYVARNLPAAASAKGGDIRVELEPARLSKQLRGLVKVAPELTLAWLSGVKQVDAVATVKPDELSLVANLTLDDALQTKLNRFKPGRIGPLLSLSKTSAVNALGQGFLDADVITHAVAAEDDAALRNAARDLSTVAGPHVSCTADGDEAAGILCQAPSENGVKATLALTQLTRVLETPAWAEKLRNGGIHLAATKPRGALPGVALNSELVGPVSVAWRPDEHEVVLAIGTQALPELATQLAAWTPAQESLQDDKVVRRWLSFDTPVYGAVMFRPGLIVRKRAMAREEAAVAMWLEPYQNRARLQLRAERDAIRFLAALMQ